MEDKVYKEEENKLIESYKGMTYDEIIQATLTFQCKYKDLGTQVSDTIKKALDEAFREIH